MLTSNLDWNLNFAKFNPQYYSISSDACMHEAVDFFRQSTRYRSIDFVYNLVSAEHVALNLSQWKLPHHSPSGRRSDKNTYRILWQICAQKPISFCSMSRITITSRAFAQHVVHGIERAALYTQFPYIVTGHTQTWMCTTNSLRTEFSSSKRRKECIENSVALLAQPYLPLQSSSTVHRFALR